MFASGFAQLTGLLDKRFVLNALLPAFAFTTASAGVAAVPNRAHVAVATWERQPALLQAGLIVLLLAWLYALALLLSSQIYTIVRAFEGYWPRTVAWVGAPSVAWHRARRERLFGDPAAYARGWTEYPVAADVLPTRLGNILRSGESYSRERYGVDAVLLWPRLYQLLPESALAPLAEARSSMEQMLLLSVLSAALGTGGGLYLAPRTVELAWPLGVLAAGWLLATAFHHSALAHAAVYSGQVRATFDLHRRKVLAALCFPPPANRADEMTMWATAQPVIYQNAQPGHLDWDYASDPPPAPQPPATTPPAAGSSEAV